MFGNAKLLRQDTVLRCDVCVIGGGVVGITLAQALAGRGLSITVLEAGGLAPDKRTQSLYKGQVDEGFLDEGNGYLHKSRLRYFGGSSNHWSGWCRPFDAIDFEVRPWVKHSGWPIGRADLDPWYDKAAPICDITAFDGDPNRHAKGGRPQMSLPADAGLNTRLFYFSKPTRWGKKYRAALKASKDVKVLFHANVVALQPAKGRRSIDHIKVLTLSRNRLEVRAKAYVLATGGIENARLMLVSDDYKGIGNDHDVVGRYFMDHVWGHDGIGRAVLSRPPPNIALYRARGVDPTVGHAIRGVLTLDPALQKSESLLQCSVLLQPIKRKREGQLDRALAATVFDLDNGLADDDRDVGPKPYLSRLHIDPELAPDPANRVTLAATKDRLGIRRTRLIWNLTALDTHSMQRTVELFSQRLGAIGHGRVRVQIDATYDWQKLRYNKHHMGTTRMSADPKQGVVDRNCKVHGLGNLWIGGSSVFPTGGFANPTFTIVALTLRLAAHLEQVLKA